MGDTLFSILFLASIGSLAGLAGGVVFLVKKDWARVLCRYAIPFAAGVLLSVSILHLIPESVEMVGEKAFFFVLGAFLFSFFFEQFFAHLHHHEERHHTMEKTAVPLVIFGDTVHNFIDGVAIAAAYLTDPVFGLIVTLATFLHETPHEIGDFGILISAGWSRRKTFLANFFSAMATFPGAIMVLFFASDLDSKIGPLLAISAGIFLYLGASDFLPQLEEETRKGQSWKKFTALLLGVLIMSAFTFIPFG